MIGSSEIELRPLDAPLGAEVIGVDASRPSDPERIEELKCALGTYGVVILRHQKLDDEDAQINFTKSFGETSVPWLHGGERNTFARLGEISPRPAYSGAHPGCVYWVNDPVHYDRPNDGFAQDWHADVSYLQVPLPYSFLYALKAPDLGYQTWYANQYSACKSLTSNIRRRFENCCIGHSFRSAFPNLPSVLHPVIRTHPRSGLKVLFGIPGYDEGTPMGIDDTEWSDVRDHLTALLKKERFVYKHTWRTGDLVIWDNRCVLHRRGPQVGGQTRILRRSSAFDGTMSDVRLNLLGMAMHSP